MVGDQRGSVVPARGQIDALASEDEQGPVVMLNLLRFADGGAELYREYAEGTLPYLEGVGGEVLVTAAPQQTVIGPQDEQWDLMVIVRYPSRSAFLAMVADPGYQKVHAKREAALLDSRLVACTPADV